MFDSSLMEKFVKDNNGSFLQSKEWQLFQKSLNRKSFIVGAYEKNSENIVFTALIIKQNLPFDKSYYYCPRGPVLSEKYKSNYDIYKFALKNIIDETKLTAKEDRAIYLKIDPEWEEKEPITDILIQTHFVKAQKNVQTKETLILDISKPEEQILKEMKQKTRYNINLAKRKRIKIVSSDNPSAEEFGGFWSLMQKTTSRKEFRSHSKEYYKNQFQIKSSNFQNKLFIAYYKKEPIVANIVNFFADKATYLYGASSDEYKNVMAPHLLQWIQIQEAKKLEMKKYDFWGICSDHSTKQEKTRWQGFTKFKKGFGGREISYVGSWDYVFNKKWYFLYNLAKKFI